MDGFVKQATDGHTLAAMVVGGLAYRLGRVGVMGSGVQSAALGIGLGLASEVTAFEGTHRTLQFLTPHSGPLTPNLFRWDGPGGIRQGLLNSLITFGALKGAGGLTGGENILVQHLVQDTAMVFGQNIAGALQVASRPTGSLAEQYFHAEATNLQLSAGMALAHGFAPGIQGLERGLDLSLRTTDVGAALRGRPQGGTHEEVPLQIGPQLSPAASGIGYGPRPIKIFAMTKREGDEGVRPPSSPKDVDEGELRKIHEGLWGRFYKAEDDFSRQQKRMQRYLTIFFARYANLITRWGYGNRDQPLEISAAERKQLERPFNLISSLVPAFAVSQREMERIQFEFRRWGIEVSAPVQKTYALFRDTNKRFSEVADTTEMNLLYVIDRPSLTLAQYSEIRRIFVDLEGKNFDWLVPTLPHTKFLPENKSGTSERDLVPSSRRLRLMGDASKEIGESFDPDTQEGRIREFWSNWGLRLGETVPPKEITATLEGLYKKFPSYFVQHLSYYVADKPLLAKVIFAQFGLLKPDSPLRKDPELVKELSHKSQKFFSQDDLEAMTRSLMSHYYWAASSHFPEKFEPLNLKEQIQWVKKVGLLPPVVLTYLTGGGLTSYETLFLLRQFGLTSLDPPAYSDLPETP